MTDNNKYLDDYGYPTSAVLAKIETWEINSNSTAMPTVWNCWSFVGSFGTTPNISEVKTASILLLPLVGLEMNPLSLHFIGIECFTCCTGIRLTGVENTYTPSTE